MKILQQYGDGINRRNIEEAVDTLRAGGIIIYPTDTLYALGCDATNNRSIERLCSIKGMNSEKNLLSIVCADLSQASVYAHIDNIAFAILRRCLPGPFTFILPSSPKLPKVFKGRHRVGVRIPDNAVALALAEELGNPLMSSSVRPEEDDVNAGFVNPDDLPRRFKAHAEVMTALVSDISGILPSTVVDLSEASAPVIVRQGKGIF